VNLRANVKYIASIGLGLLAACALANQIVPKPYVAPPTYTNCGTYFKCNVADHYTGTIDPCCCSIDASGCEDYKIDTWQCAAGGTLYDNFRFSRGPYVASTCGGSGFPACH